MEFTVELRYRSGSSTILSTEAETADQALDRVRDPRRELIGIRISAPSAEAARPDREPEADHRGQTATFRREPARHRPSRRSH
jgi:hypothetical protein